MPESKVRDKVAKKRRRVKRAEERRERFQRTTAAPGSRRWVPPTFIAVGLLGVAWLIVYYVAGAEVPYMQDLRDWNVLIGMGLMASSFIIATLWK